MEDKYDFSFDKLSNTIENEIEVVAPLVDAEITIEDLLPETEETNRFLEIGTDNFIKLIYEDTIATVPAFDMFDGTYSGFNLPALTHDASPETVVLDMDGLLNEGRVYFADPKMTITIINYWGVTANFSFLGFQYVPKEGDSGTPVEGTAIDATYSILPPGSEGFSETKVTLDRTNSNIDEVISALPYSISAGARIEVPGGQDYTVDENTSDTVMLRVEMPLDFLAEDIIRVDTTDFDFLNSYEDEADAIDSLNFYIEANNGLPVEVYAQVYFTDNNWNVLDSISSDGINIKPGESENGVNNAIITQEILKMADSKIENIVKAKKLIYMIKLDTRNAELDETVKLYSNYMLGLKLGGKVNANKIVLED